MTATTWRSELTRLEARTRLERHDIRRILERASGYDGAELHLHLDDPVSEQAAAHVADMVRRRATGEPLQYVLGVWAFRRLDLLVDRRVLIPRPETEVVVEVALGEIERLATGRPGAGRPLVAVDLGTGSGAIALSLAAEAGAEVWATDRSAAALEVARANLAGLGGAAATRVRLLEGDWFAPLPAELAGRVDLVVSNPPYVADAEVGALPPEVRDWEPAGALFAGPTGLEDVARIVAGAPAWLARPGALVVEVAPHQAGEAVRLALASGFDEAEVRPDLSGRPRALVGRFRGVAAAGGPSAG